MSTPTTTASVANPSLFLTLRRGLIERCPHAKIFNFISLAGQHQGIYGTPKCPSETNFSCELLRKFLNLFAYTDWAQSHIAQATYWHDPIRAEQYRERSTFIAEINNEKSINKDYVYRLHRLNRFVMVKFLRDEMVQPLESQWFGFYAPGSNRIIQNLTTSEIYSSDKLGLKQMMEDEKLFFLSVDDVHLKISREWFSREIVPLLKEGEK